MPNNIFLTGQPGAGKSTIIKNVVAELNIIPGGFIVNRKGERNCPTGFFLINACKINSLRGISKNYEERRDKRMIIFASRKDCGDCWQINKEVFDKTGVELLEEGKSKDIIIMDELGRFELDALRFRQKVIELLDAEIHVLGVIKDESNSFMDGIRNLNHIELLI